MVDQASADLALAGPWVAPSVDQAWVAVLAWVEP